MTILATLKQAATNNVLASTTGSTGILVTAFAWFTENLGFFSWTVTFGLLCVAGFTAYTSWRFKHREDRRKQEMHDIDLQIKWAELRPSSEGIDHVG